MYIIRLERGTKELTELLMLANDFPSLGFDVIIQDHIRNDFHKRNILIPFFTLIKKNRLGNGSYDSVEICLRGLVNVT